MVGHYVGRGYRVDPSPVVTGESGNEYRLGLMATDGLGRLAVWWGDQEPFEGPELESLRRAAKDLGAAPAIATPQVTNLLRDHARKYGIVVIDEKMLDSNQASTAAPIASRSPTRFPSTSRPVEKADIPAWPDPNREPAPRREATQAPISAPWKNPVATTAPGSAAASRRPFDWLGEEQPTAILPEPVHSAAPQPIMPTFWAPILYTAIALLVLILILAFTL